jgi:hypothetical protein
MLTVSIHIYFINTMWSGHCLVLSVPFDHSIDFMLEDFYLSHHQWSPTSLIAQVKNRCSMHEANKSKFSNHIPLSWYKKVVLYFIYVWIKWINLIQSSLFLGFSLFRAVLLLALRGLPAWNGTGIHGFPPVYGWWKWC